MEQLIIPATGPAVNRRPDSGRREGLAFCPLPLYWYQEMTPKLGERMLQL